MIIERDALLSAWVQNYINLTHIEPIPGDASTRRYFRVYEEDKSFIAVDAHPSFENNEAFVHIAAAFSQHGLQVPTILEANFKAGFLLLSDLGDIHLLKILNPQNVHRHYARAMEELIKIQHCSMPSWQLPLYNSNLLLTELNYFREWYLMRHVGIHISAQETTMLQKVYDLLINSAQAQPYACVHRDYHSRNLMVLANDKIGVLDFQDAVIGPITYDLASLVKDCYIKWQPEQIYQWVEQFWSLLKKPKQAAWGSLLAFKKSFDWMGLQRHLKVLGIFARLYQRDSKAAYLNDIPRTLDYVLFVCDRYEEFKPLYTFIVEKVLPLQRINP